LATHPVLADFIATMSNSKTAVPLLTPPEHFGIVEKGLYRSEMFQQSHFSFIKQLDLKTVVVLSPEQPNRHTLAFLEECGTKLVCVRMLWSCSTEAFYNASLKSRV
jgi:Tyrosine phosphatase family